MSTPNQPSFAAYLKAYIPFVAIIGIALYLLGPQLPARLQSPAVAYLYAFFVLSTPLLHYILIALSKQRPQQFINMFMAITGAKLFLYLIIIMVYLALSEKQGRLGFVLGFLAFYLSFTAFEVVLLLKMLNKQNPENN